jgi:hypothetical protein
MEVAQHLALGGYEKFSARRLVEGAALPDTEFDAIVHRIEHKKHDRKKTAR